jgi:hypothetical protein
LFHNQITKSLTACHILEEITDSNIEYATFDRAKWVVDSTLECINLHKLHRDIIHLSATYKLDYVILIDKDYWVKFCQFLLEHLLDKPIKFPVFNKNTIKEKKYMILYVLKPKKQEV